MAEDIRSQAYWQERLNGNDQKSSTIWWNVTNHHSLRLTKVGLALAGRSDIKFHTVNLQEKIKPRHFLLLERTMPAPYYIKKLDQVYVMDETVAIMLTLHAGDLDTCLSNLFKYG